MRNLLRNEREFWYCPYAGAGTYAGDGGTDTGIPTPTYGEPVACLGNVTAASGDAAQEQFGIGVAYDKVIQLQGTGWPIGEDTVLFVDREPPEPFDPSDVPYDYSVVRVSESLNQTSVAIARAR